MDGLDESNAALKEKWKIGGYPTLIYTDSTGKALGHSGATDNSDDLKRMILDFLQKHS
jgi:hypothetical protein